MKPRPKTLGMPRFFETSLQGDEAILEVMRSAAKSYPPRKFLMEGERRVEIWRHRNGRRTVGWGRNQIYLDWEILFGQLPNGRFMFGLGRYKPDPNSFSISQYNEYRMFVEHMLDTFQRTDPSFREVTADGTAVESKTSENPATPRIVPAIGQADWLEPAKSPATWHPDPWGTSRLRYWDGEQWTHHVAD